ncbi:MAG: iron ABC transporter permease [Actinomycetota bacterium]|nr:iron ABC transporter permease [Actinomycetota bacterium]
MCRARLAVTAADAGPVEVREGLERHLRPDDIPARRESDGMVHTTRGRSLVLLVCLGVLALLMLLSLMVGAKQIPLATVVDAVFAYDASLEDHLVIRTLRLPRTVLAVLAGMAFGLGGAVIQGLSRNPLADPGLLGVNQGAAAATVVAISFFGLGSLSQYIWFSFAGAAITSVIVYWVASLGREGATPVKITLAGAALTVFLGSVTSAIVLTDAHLLLALRRWTVGSLVGRPLELIAEMAPFMVVGVVIALMCGPALNALALGDDMARGLGQRVGLARAVSALSVVIMVGAATAVAGPVGFVGLVIPHVARAFIGPDYRWILAYTLVLSPAFLLLCDIVGRVVMRPAELQAGFVTIAIGGPFFVWLVRQRDLAEL